MPFGSNFSFSVECGGKKLKEYKKDNKFYVESELNIPDVSYLLVSSELACGEEESQSWPVTPYKIVLNPIHHRNRTCWYEVYCDGAYIWNKPLSGGKAFTIDGFTKDGVNREMLFSLPRFARTDVDRTDKERLSEIGTISVRCIEAIYEGSRMTQFKTVRDFSNKESVKGAGDGFDQVNKKDCSRRDGGNQGLTTTKSGRERFRFTEADRPTYRPLQRFKRGKLLETLTINYRMRHCLIDMGLIEGDLEPVAPVMPIKHPLSIKLSPVDCKKAVKIKREALMIDETLSKMKELNISSMAVIDPKKQIKEELVTRLNEDGVEEKFIIRQNRIAIPQKRIIHIDDDIQIIEDMDDSVVYIGDEDCVCIDGPTEVIPYLELH